jgi:predicted PurR-regulated permease PerM
MDSGNQRKRVLRFFLICFLLAAIGLGWLLLPFFSIIVLGAVISGMAYPIFLDVEKRLKGRSTLAALITCFFIFLILFVPIVLFVGSLAQQAYGLYDMAKGAVISEQINRLLSQSQLLERANAVLATFNYTLTGEEIRKTITEIGRVTGLFLYEQALAVASNTAFFVINFLLTLLVCFFLFLDGKGLVNYFINLSPLPAEQEYILMAKFLDMANAVLIGNGLAGLIQGALGGLVFWVLGLPSAFLWGVVMGILAFLPVLGIGLVLMPAAVYLFLIDRIAAGVFVLIFYAVIMIVAEYIFKPKFVGDRAKMHPLLVFFVIISGIKILGIIYGPLIATAFLTLADIYRADYQGSVEPRES